MMLKESIVCFPYSNLLFWLYLVLWVVNIFKSTNTKYLSTSADL